MKITDVVLCEMARVLTPEDTGIKNGIHIKLEPIGGHHGPRIKVSNIRNGFSRQSNFVVTVDRTNPTIIGTPVSMSKHELSSIKYWVSINQEILFHIWRCLESNTPQQVIINGEYVPLDFYQLLTLLKPIS